MVFALFHRLTEAEKDALLRDQQKLTGQMAARISELEALFGKPRTPSFNSSKPPLKDDFRGNRPRSGKGGKRPSLSGGCPRRLPIHHRHSTPPWQIRHRGHLRTHRRPLRARLKIGSHAKNVSNYPRGVAMLAPIGGGLMILGLSLIHI